jgi:hypothetical protein
LTWEAWSFWPTPPSLPQNWKLSFHISSDPYRGTGCKYMGRFTNDHRQLEGGSELLLAGRQAGRKKERKKDGLFSRHPNMLMPKSSDSFLKIKSNQINSSQVKL